LVTWIRCFLNTNEELHGEQMNTLKPISSKKNRPQSEVKLQKISFYINKDQVTFSKKLIEALHQHTETKMPPIYFLNYRLQAKVRKVQNARLLDQMVTEISTPNVHLSQHPD